MKEKIFTSFVIYGIMIGFMSYWWQGFSDTILFLNVPGVILGDKVYSLAINYLGNPNSAQAHFTIPWILRIRQIYVPASVIFWGLMGLAVQLVVLLFRNGRQPKTS